MSDGGCDLKTFGACLQQKQSAGLFGGTFEEQCAPEAIADHALQVLAQIFEEWMFVGVQLSKAAVVSMDLSGEQPSLRPAGGEAAHVLV